MSMGYGRKIIDYIFKKRSERLTICYEPERKIQADSDRSDIRVFETGISTQQHGDNWQSTGNAEDEECSRSIKIDKEQGLYMISLIGICSVTGEYMFQVPSGEIKILSPNFRLLFNYTLTYLVLALFHAILLLCVLVVFFEESSNH